MNRATLLSGLLVLAAVSIGRHSFSGKQVGRFDRDVRSGAVLAEPVSRHTRELFSAPSHVAASSFAQDFSHDKSATFEPHGDEVCASGCALSNHATDTLSEIRFRQLLDAYGGEPLREDAQALETLLFYGPQTRKLLALDHANLDDRHALFLREQLEFTHVRVSLRMVDEEGTPRAWTEPTSVPLDRRHVFEMQTNDMPRQVMSGTFKRVGLNHIWARL